MSDGLTLRICCDSSVYYVQHTTEQDGDIICSGYRPRWPISLFTFILSSAGQCVLLSSKTRSVRIWVLPCSLFHLGGHPFTWIADVFDWDRESNSWLCQLMAYWFVRQCRLVESGQLKFIKPEMVSHFQSMPVVIKHSQQFAGQTILFPGHSCRLLGMMLILIDIKPASHDNPQYEPFCCNIQCNLHSIIIT